MFAGQRIVWADPKGRDGAGLRRGNGFLFPGVLARSGGICFWIAFDHAGGGTELSASAGYRLMSVMGA